MDDIQKMIISISVLFVVLLVLALIIYLIKINNHKTDSFNKTFKSYKQVEMALTLNLEEQTVEKYYVYDQYHKSEVISLDEFYLKLCDINICDRLNQWLKGIKENGETNRLELAMYDENNKKRVYKAELDRFDEEHDCYYITLRDTTDSPEVIKRANKIVNNTNIDEFYEKANKIIENSEEGSSFYLTAIKYREYKDIKKILKSNDYLNLIDTLIYSELNEKKNPNDILVQSNDGQILLFSSTLLNEKKFKKTLRRLVVFEASKKYTVNKRRYTISLCCGVTSVIKNEGLTVDKKFEAEAAVEETLNHTMSERIRYYDSTLVEKRNEDLKLKAQVQKIIEDNDFDYKYTKIFNMNNKKLYGFYFDFAVKTKDVLINKNDFLDYCRQIGNRKALYTKIFSQMVSHNLYNNDSYYISINYQDIEKVIEAYCSDKSFKKLNVYFSISFNNLFIKSYHDILDVEKKITKYRKELKIHFGINYNALQTLYLNEKIYSQVEFVLFSGDIVSSSLDNYSNSSLIDMYVKVAKKYKHTIVAVDVSSFAIYELFARSHIDRIGGTVFALKPDACEITDKLLLQKLETIESKDY